MTTKPLKPLKATHVYCIITANPASHPIAEAALFSNPVGFNVSISTESTNPTIPNMKVLVAYATVFGSTRAIAERIATRISTASHGDYTTTVLPVDAQPPPNISEYDALIIGSCIHGQRWIKPARKFIKAHYKQFRSDPKPIWVFSVGVPEAKPQWRYGREKAKVEKELRKNVSFKSHELLNGEWKAESTPPVTLCCFKWRRFDEFGDYREWDVVDAWADSVLLQLQTVLEVN
jgi:menaquinone-dependent protoporphyrinogen oxidase